MNKNSTQDAINQIVDKLPIYKIVQGTLNNGSFLIDGESLEIQDVKELMVNGINSPNSAKKGIMLISLNNQEKYFLPLGGQNIINFDTIQFCKSLMTILNILSTKPVKEGIAILTPDNLIEIQSIMGGL